MLNIFQLLHPWWWYNGLSPLLRPISRKIFRFHWVFTCFYFSLVHLKSKRCLPAFLSIAARCSHYFQIYDSLRLSIPSNFYLNLHSCDCDIMVIVMWIVGSYLKNMTAIWKTWPTRWWWIGLLPPDLSLNMWS